MESATPAVDHPVGGVDEREVDKDVVFHFTIIAWSTAAMPPLLLASTTIKLYKKRGVIKGDLQHIQTIKLTQFPKE